MTIISKEYDIIIVGAGTAGCTCAIHAAHKGLDVCIVERKNKEKIGNKVCGDLIGYSLFDWLNKYLNLNYLKKGVINNWIDYIDTYTPNKKTVLSVKERFCMIDRHKFGRTLLNDALAAGCKLYDSCVCMNPVIKDNFVCGVKIRDEETDIISTLRSKIVIDASGASPVLRKKVQLEDSYFENEIDKKDEVFSYREVRRLKKPVDDSATAKIFMSGKYAKCGYYWFFPERDDVINIGIGIRRSMDTSTLKKNLEKIMLNEPMFEDSEVIHYGGGMLPVRRQLNSLVANGFMCAGDSASQISPISGGGIAQSMMGGYMCAEVGAKAIKYGDVSQEELWQLNILYADRTGREDMGYNLAMFDGASQAAAEILKIFIIGLDDDDINFAMKTFIDSSMLAKMGAGDVSEVTFSRKMMIVLKSMHKMPLLMRFKRIVCLVDMVKKLYRIYPETPDAFPEWKMRLDSLFEDVYKVSGIDKAE